MRKRALRRRVVGLSIWILGLYFFTGCADITPLDPDKKPEPGQSTFSTKELGNGGSMGGVAESDGQGAAPSSSGSMDSGAK